ncbi:hypothetical protein TNCT_203541 [Trichonephila clavata]|uniref:Uncharacterized protein n=1 Tax=Trichonephila clavata TaxID=2740835 RepID=A0A8X6FWL5_TRICU|nr:hypothetical protein TNCT_203541 [Trichonephila clavata]
MEQRIFWCKKLKNQGCATHVVDAVGLSRRDENADISSQNGDFRKYLSKAVYVKHPTGKSSLENRIHKRVHFIQHRKKFNTPEGFLNSV